ncbi:unnamed protein product, partial [Ixodes pacificus]
WVARKLRAKCRVTRRAVSHRKLSSSQCKRKKSRKREKGMAILFTGKPCSPSKYCVDKKGAPKVCLSSAPGRFAAPPPHPDWHVLYSYHNHKRINFGKFKQAILRPFLAMRNQLLLLR